MIDRLYRYILRFGIALLMLPLIPAVLSALCVNADPLGLFVLLLLASGTAYVIRERRRPRRARPKRLAGVERKPLLPRMEHFE